MAKVYRVQVEILLTADEKALLNMLPVSFPNELPIKYCVACCAS